MTLNCEHNQAEALRQTPDGASSCEQTGSACMCLYCTYECKHVYALEDCLIIWVCAPSLHVLQEGKETGQRNRTKKTGTQPTLCVPNRRHFGIHEHVRAVRQTKHVCSNVCVCDFASNKSTILSDFRLH